MQHPDIFHFEQLILRHVVNLPSDKNLTPAEVTTIEERIQAERIKLEMRLSDLLCSAEPDLVISRKLRFNHIKLVNLSNQVYQILKEKQGNIDGLAAVAMENIITLLKTGSDLAAHYIDNTIPLSNHYVDTLGGKLKQDFEQLKTVLLKDEADHGLIEALSIYFEDINSNNGRVFFNKNLDYAQKLLRGLQKTINDNSADTATKLWRLLVYYNFNKKQVLQYAAAFIRRISKGDDPYMVIQEKLLLLLKHTRQMEENPDFKYLENRASLKAYSIEMIEEELTWFQQHRSNLLTEMANASDNFIIVDSTVRRLNLWAEINVDIGHIPYHTPLQTVKVMTNFIRTLKPGPVSYGSARRKMDGYDSTTVQGLYLWLKKQMDHLEEKYAEQIRSDT